jgi:hypothetical protein
MAKSPEEMQATMIANLKKNTGNALAAWLKIVRASKAEKHGAIVKHLKSEHGVTHGYANLIAHQALGSDAPSAPTGDLVATQYNGKDDLRPIYDKLIKAVGRFGSDVEVSPKKAYVSLRRSKQFGIIQPSTKSRLDVGITLKGVKPTDRLEAAGSFNSMVSHRVRLTAAAQVDEELLGWLKSAYTSA